MNKEEFVNALKALNINITNKQLEQLDRYYHLLIEWNKKINLTRIIEEKDVYLKHFYDSITICRVIDLQNNMSVCDVGTGAGFPGIVLKILFPSLSITLIDSLQKRVNFLNMVINELELNDIVATHVRAEDYLKINKNKFDLVVSRAVANLPLLLTMCIPLVKKAGSFVAMKANCQEEIENSASVLKKLHAKIIKVEEFDLPIENSHRTIIQVIKNN